MSHEILKTQSEYYKVTTGTGTSLGAEGYSKFFERFALKQEGKLEEPIYGLPQAIEHAKEYREVSDQYTQERKSAIIKIVKVTVVEEIVTTV